jgi:hypothetical protein
MELKLTKSEQTILFYLMASSTGWKLSLYTSHTSCGYFPEGRRGAGEGRGGRRGGDRVTEASEENG